MLRTKCSAANSVLYLCRRAPSFCPFLNFIVCKNSGKDLCSRFGMTANGLSFPYSETNVSYIMYNKMLYICTQTFIIMVWGNNFIDHVYILHNKCLCLYHWWTSLCHLTLSLYGVYPFAGMLHLPPPWQTCNQALYQETHLSGLSFGHAVRRNGRNLCANLLEMNILFYCAYTWWVGIYLGTNNTIQFSFTLKLFVYMLTLEIQSHIVTFPPICICCAVVGNVMNKPLAFQPKKCCNILVIHTIKHDYIYITIPSNLFI